MMSSPENYAAACISQYSILGGWLSWLIDDC